MKKRLYRSRKERMIGGVAGGIAEYYDADPVLVRIAFVALVFVHGIGAIAYFILWIVVRRRPMLPLDREAENGRVSAFEENAGTVVAASQTEAATDENGRGNVIIGGILIVIGAIFLLDNLFPGMVFKDLWPIALIGLGAGILWHAWK